MNFLCYVNIKKNEYKSLLDGTKTIIAESTNSRKNYYKKVFIGDTIYLVNKKAGKTIIRARVANVINYTDDADGLSDGPADIYKDRLGLPENKISRMKKKKYMLLMELNDIEKINDSIKDLHDIGMVIRARLN